MSFGVSDKFLFLGRSGSGKSYIARRISAAYPRKVIFDTLGEYSSSDGIVCHDFHQFCEEILKTEHSEKFTIIYQFDVESSHETDEFNEALRVLWYRGNVFVLVEEIQNFATPHSIPHWVKKCLFTGRHRNLALGFTTQRPGECHKSVISQANHVFFGSLHEKNDLEYCKSVLGNRCFLLSTLPPQTFFYFRPGAHQLMKLNPNGKMVTVSAEELT